MTLEQQLRASIQLLSMQQAIELALPLLQNEHRSLRDTAKNTPNHFLAQLLSCDVADYEKAITACQKALEPVQAAVEVDEPIRLVRP